ncbi:MAG: protein kinase [Pseudomonadota bacterium]
MTEQPSKPTGINRTGVEESLALSEFYTHVEETEFSLLDIPISNRISIEKHWASTTYVGRKIGDYTIREVIYQGAVSAVLIATENNHVGREVAIKILSPFAPESIKELFTLEQCAVLQLRHPYVISIYQTGMDIDQAPYIVMELVDGVSLYEYCRIQKLSFMKRLALMEKICEALSYCHFRGISHGDIKSANILIVDDGTEPKPIIIDFGIATSLDFLPSHAELPKMGTPETMSPEHLDQVNRISESSDIYSLGMLLFGLLIGYIPFDRSKFNKLTSNEKIRQIASYQPGPPGRYFFSVVESERAKIEQGYPQSDRLKIKRFIGEEVDWIFNKATSTNSELRYDSALSLRLDLTRLRKLRPVSVAPDSHSYRFRKLFHRNTPLAVIGSLLIVSSAVFLFSLQQSKSRELKANSVASKAADSSVAVADLSTNMLDLANPYLRNKVVDEDLTFLLDQSYKQVLDRKGLDPEIKGSLLLEIARNYLSISELEKTALAAQQVSELEPLHGTLVHDQLLLIQGKLAEKAGDHRLARQLAREALVSLSERPGFLPEQITAILQTAYSEYLLRNNNEAKRLVYKAFELTPKLADQDWRVRASVSYYGGLVHASQQTEQDPMVSISMLSEAVKLVQDRLPVNHPLVLDYKASLGHVYRRRSMNQNAIELLQPMAELVPDGVSGDKVYYLNIMAQLGYAYKAINQPDKAIPLLEFAALGYGRREGEAGVSAVYSRLNLAESKILAGQLGEAEDILHDLFSIVIVADRFQTSFIRGRVLDAFSELQIAKGELNKALDFALLAEQKHHETSGAVDGYLATSLAQQAGIYIGMSKPQAALETAQRAIEYAEKAYYTSESQHMMPRLVKAAAEWKIDSTEDARFRYETILNEVRGSGIYSPYMVSLLETSM